jgi:hypothetical protein
MILFHFKNITSLDAAATKSRYLRMFFRAHRMVKQSDVLCIIVNDKHILWKKSFRIKSSDIKHYTEKVSGTYPLKNIFWLTVLEENK